MPLKKSSLLVISFNENEQYFTNENLESIIANIKTSFPSIIFVCTQKSNKDLLMPWQSAKHFPHVLGDILTQNLGDNNYELLIKSENISGLRTRVYYRGKNNINEKNPTPNNNNLFKNESKSYKSNIKKNCGVDIIKINKYGIFSANNCIRVRVEFQRNDILHKIVVLNTDLSNSSVKIDSIITKFNLNNFSEKGYNIFFCGDFNSKIITPPSILNENNNKELFYNTNKTKMNELHYNLFNQKSKLKQNLRKSINTIGLEKIYNNNKVSIHNRILFSLPISLSLDSRENDQLIINDDSFKILDINKLDMTTEKCYISTLTCYYNNTLLQVK